MAKALESLLTIGRLLALASGKKPLELLAFFIK
jgi:hypothetical protein